MPTGYHSPDLSDLVAAPERVGEVSLVQVPAMLVQVAALQSALAARLLSNHGGTDAVSAQEDDPTISTEEAMRIMGISSRRVFYRRTKGLPFVRVLSRKNHRYVKSGLLKWYERQRG